MRPTLAIVLLLLCAPFTLCTDNQQDGMQKRDGFDGLGMQPFSGQFPQGPQMPMAAPQGTFMQGAPSNFPMSNPMAFGGGMGGFGMGGAGQGSPFVQEADDGDDEETGGGGLSGLFSSSMMSMLPMAGLAFLGGLTFSSLSGLVLEMIGGLQTNANPNGNRVNADQTGTNRQRRDLSEDLLYKMHTFRKILATMPNKKIYDSSIAAKYLACSGLADDNNLCLERATCEFTSANSSVSDLQKEALSITVMYILKNDHVPQGIKERIRKVANSGGEQCEKYHCKFNMFT